MSGPIPRIFVSDPNGNGGSYYSTEEFLNELSVILLNNNTKKALAVALVDTSGVQVAPKTIISAGGSAAASGNNTIVVAGTNRLKVCAFSLTTVSATAMTCIFQSGASGTELWRVVIMAPAGANAGANLSIAPPAWLFATASATLLNLNLSSANAVNWAVSYYEEA